MGNGRYRSLWLVTTEQRPEIALATPLENPFWRNDKNYNELRAEQQFRRAQADSPSGNAIMSLSAHYRRPPSWSATNCEKRAGAEKQERIPSVVLGRVNNLTTGREGNKQEIQCTTLFPAVFQFNKWKSYQWLFWIDKGKTLCPR